MRSIKFSPTYTNYIIDEEVIEGYKELLVEIFINAYDLSHCFMISHDNFYGNKTIESYLLEEMYNDNFEQEV